MDQERLIIQLSNSQGGAIRLDQVLGAGMTRDQVKYRLRTGRWTKLNRGAYLVTAMGTVQDHIRAAIATLPGAVVAHESAAELHDLAYVQRGLATVLVHSQTTHEFPGAIVRRCHDLSADHVVELDGLPVTTPPRTVVDLASVISERNLTAVLDDAVAARKMTVEAVAEIAQIVGRSGKPGTQKLRTVLESRVGPMRNASPLERKGAELLLLASTTPPEFEYEIPWCPGKRFDAAYPHAQLAIEWDSQRWHLQASAFRRDRARDRAAIIHGWRVLRFTWEDVTQHADDVVTTVRTALMIASVGS
jgi:hypothetical protein